METKSGGMMNIFKNIVTFLGGDEILFPPKDKLPSWIPPVREPAPFNPKSFNQKDLCFNITENVCGLTATYGFAKKGVLSNFVVYDNKGKQIPYNKAHVAWQFPKVYSTLVDIRQHYNANEVVLQVKILEKDNYYNLAPKILAFCLYIDGIEQELTDMIYWLRRHNIEAVPILDLKRQINENTKEKYSVQSLLSNVPSKGIICTNRQKSLSFLL